MWRMTEEDSGYGLSDFKRLKNVSALVLPEPLRTLFSLVVRAGYYVQSTRIYPSLISPTLGMDQWSAVWGPWEGYKAFSASRWWHEFFFSLIKSLAWLCFIVVVKRLCCSLVVYNITFKGKRGGLILCFSL